MTLAESLEYLHRLQQWRTAEPRVTTPEDHRLTGKQTTAAIDAILTLVPQLQKTHLSVCSKLRKCQVQRQAYNLQLRRELKSPEPPSSPDRGF